MQENRMIPSVFAVAMVVYPSHRSAFLTNGDVAWPITDPRLAAWYLSSVYEAPPGWQVLNDLPPGYTRFEDRFYNAAPLDSVVEQYLG